MTFEELVIASKAYADRYDLEIDDNMNTFVIMVESRINRLLKTRQQTARTALVISSLSEAYTLPEDWLGMRDINLIVSTLNPDTFEETFCIYPYHLLDPKTFTAKRLSSSSSSQNYYVILDDQINIYPIPDTSNPDEYHTIEMVYYQKCPHLMANTIPEPAANTNWLSEEQPDIYLSGICAEISLFAKDYDAAQTWYNRLDTSVNELDNVDWIERWSGDPLQIRLG